MLGRLANELSDHLMAQAFFESAYNAKDDISALVSSVNMRLKLGQLALAASVYRKLLTDDWDLPAALRETVGRKLAEANEAMAVRAQQPAPLRLLEDEVAQLLRDRRGTLGSDADEELFRRLLRKQGHAANEMGDADAA